MTTKFLTIKSAKFPNLIVMEFPRRKKSNVFGQFFVNFPSSPTRSKTRSLLILSFRRLWFKRFIHDKSARILDLRKVGTTTAKRLSLLYRLSPSECRSCFCQSGLANSWTSEGTLQSFSCAAAFTLTHPFKGAQTMKSTLWTETLELWRRKELNSRFALHGLGPS